MTKRKDPKDFLPSGQPSKYRVEYDEIAYNHLSQGFSMGSLRSKIPVCEDTIYEWIKVHPSFSENIKNGKAAGMEFFEKILLAKTSGKDLKGFDPKKSDTTCLIFALKTRFHKHYGEKQKHEIEVSTISINIDSDDADL